MTFFAWPVLGLIWLLDHLWERWRARQSLPPPRPVVHRAPVDEHRAAAPPSASDGAAPTE